MSATKDFCKTQVGRLSVTPLFAPKTRQAGEDWLNTLMCHCQSNDHAERVMTQFLENCTEAKNPLAEIVIIARETERHDEPPPGCSECELGPDETTGEMRWAAHIGGERNGVSCAVRCVCDRGKWLLAKDVERMKSAGKKPVKRTAPMTRVRDAKTLAAGNQED